MVSRARVVRGEIWLATLDPTVGSEIQKTRPCVVVSPPELHDYLRTVMVVPMTTGSQPAAFRVPVTFQGNLCHGAAEDEEDSRGLSGSGSD